MRKLTATCVAITCLLLLLLLSNNLFSQSDFFESPNFSEGQIDINIGVGLIPTFYTGNRGLLPLSVSGEYGVTDDISVGGYVGFSTSNSSVITKNDVRYTYTIIGIRGSYHVNLSEKLDTYFGLMLGYNRVNVKYDDDFFFANYNPTSSSGIYSGFIGSRYHFNEKMGVFAEIGYGISWLTLGFTTKL